MDGRVFGSVTRTVKILRLPVAVCQITGNFYVKLTLNTDEIGINQRLNVEPTITAMIGSKLLPGSVLLFPMILSKFQNR